LLFGKHKWTRHIPSPHPATALVFEGSAGQGSRLDPDRRVDRHCVWLSARYKTHFVDIIGAREALGKPSCFGVRTFLLENDCGRSNGADRICYDDDRAVIRVLRVRTDERGQPTGIKDSAKTGTPILRQ
jgi:hypothetical protein